MDCCTASNRIISRTTQVSVFEQTDESRALQQCYVVLYAKYVCNTNHFLQVYMDIRAMYTLFATVILFLFSSKRFSFRRN